MKQFRQLATAFVTIAFAISLLGASGERARVTDLGHRMMCVCGCNQILLECNHVGCTYSDRMREQLIKAVQKNSSDDEKPKKTFINAAPKSPIAMKYRGLA